MGNEAGHSVFALWRLDIHVFLEVKKGAKVYRFTGMLLFSGQTEEIQAAFGLEKAILKG